MKRSEGELRRMKGSGGVTQVLPRLDTLRTRRGRGLMRRKVRVKVEDTAAGRQVGRQVDPN